MLIFLSPPHNWRISYWNFAHYICEIFRLNYSYFFRRSLYFLRRRVGSSNEMTFNWSVNYCDLYFVVCYVFVDNFQLRKRWKVLHIYITDKNWEVKNVFDIKETFGKWIQNANTRKLLNLNKTLCQVQLLAIIDG